MKSLFSASFHLKSNIVISKFAFTLGFNSSFVLDKISAQDLYIFERELIKAFTITIINPAHTQ
ncbi:MAG: hypothetical protein LBQ24_04965 [Candidatus Peribacteria bacterium]|jgi:hypothetical protein|nr:hypothetical protein [Candidatus Peribacteria bacterium]